jgi:hypothetical protein
VLTDEGSNKANSVPFAGLGFLSLLILQFLHVLWSLMILRMVWGVLVNGKVSDDIREEDAESKSK